MKHFGIYHPSLHGGHNNQQNDWGLSDDDIDRIQEILDESIDDDYDDDDDDVVFLSEEIPKPKKSTQKNLN